MNMRRLKRLARRQNFTIVRPGDSVIVAIPAGTDRDAAQRLKAHLVATMPDATVTVVGGIPGHLIYRPKATS